MDGQLARRTFVAAWITLGCAGALNHTIAEKVLGRRLDLVLPHLKYGYVMFNRNPRTVDVYEYARSRGERHDLADLLVTPAPGYKSARLAVDLAFQPRYLAEVCRSALRRGEAEFEVVKSEYQVDTDTNRLSSTTTVHCGPRGLSPLDR